MIPDVAVVGGGIVGLAVAAAIADRGARVILIDLPKPGAASRAAAGLLAPSLELPSEAVGALFRTARDAYPAYVDALRDRTRIAATVDRSGILQVAMSEEEAAALEPHARVTGRWLPSEEVARMEPHLVRTHGSAFWPDDGWVDNIALMTALEAVADGHPNITRARMAVSSIHAADRSRPVVETEEATRIQCGTVVLAAGAWTGQIKGVRSACAVTPLRGQLVRLAGALVTRAIYTHDGYLVPRGAATVAGTTMEAVGFDAGTTPAARDSIASVARRLCPSLGLELDAWSGLRPATPDLLPLIGPDPAEPSIVYACGHSRNGILLAPLTAEIVSATIFEDNLNFDVSVFRPDRFEGTFSTP